MKVELDIQIQNDRLYMVAYTPALKPFVLLDVPIELVGLEGFAALQIHKKNEEEKVEDNDSED